MIHHSRRNLEEVPRVFDRELIDNALAIKLTDHALERCDTASFFFALIESNDYLLDTKIRDIYFNELIQIRYLSFSMHLIRKEFIKC